MQIQEQAPLPNVNTRTMEPSSLSPVSLAALRAPPLYLLNLKKEIFFPGVRSVAFISSLVCCAAVGPPIPSDFFDSIISDQAQKRENIAE